VSLFVQQESGTACDEIVQTGLIGTLDFGDRLPRQQSVQGRSIAEQAQVAIGFPCVRVIEPELTRNGEACRQWLEFLPVTNCDSNSTALFAGELAGIRRKFDRGESYSRQSQRIETLCKQFAIKPRRSEHFKRCSRAATDREVGRLEQTDTGVQQRFGKTAHIRRRVDPDQARVVEELCALPATHLNDLQIEVELEFGLQQQRDFADGHPVSNCDGVKADKRLQTIVKHGATNVDAIDRIWPVEDDEANAVVGRGDHGIAHGRYVGIEARTDVLNIEHDGVYILQHCGGRPSNLAVKTDHLNSGTRVEAITDDLGIELAGKTVLGAEDSHELDVRSVVQQVNTASPVASDARVVREQTDSGAGQLPEFIAFENVDSRQNNSRIGLCQNREQQQKNFYQPGFHQADTIEQALWK